MVPLDQPDVPQGTSPGEGRPGRLANPSVPGTTSVRDSVLGSGDGSNMHSLCTFVVAYPCVVPSASIGGGGAPKVDIAFHGVLVDGGEFLCREVQVVEGGDTLLQLGDTARPDED